MPSAQPSDFNLPTFIVATVGAVTGLFSAVWVVVPHVSAGAKIRVTLKYVFEIARGPVFDVTAYNRRRGSVEIMDWGIGGGPRGRDGLVLLGNSTPSEGDGPRKTVQGLHSASWRVLARHMVVFEENRDRAVSIRAVVELGNGKQVWSKPLKLPAGSLHQAPLVVLDED
jgi:hypothetical protein